MFGDYPLSLHDYLSILRRRALVMILVFGAVLTASVVFALMQPKVYESTATILVEGPQVQVQGTTGDAASQLRPEDRINLIRQRLMTRESLVRVAQRHELFSPTGAGDSGGLAVAEAMRRSIRLDVMGGASEPWMPRSASVSFNLSFQHENPEKALAVTRELADLFLTSNRKERVDQASRTKEFLSGEAERVRKELEVLDAKVASFKSQQAGASTDGAASALGGLPMLEAELRNAERDYRQALNELRSLEVELAAARRGVMAPGAVERTGPTQTEQDLDRARAQLAGLRATYSDSHPDVLSLQRRIQSLEQAVVAESRVVTPSRSAARAQAELAASRIETQIEAARSRSDLFASQQASLRARISQLRSQAAQAPQLERQLEALQRDREAARTKYEELRTQLLSAQVVANLEGGQQAERFTLLEPPLLPNSPISPSRKKIVVAGFAAAIAAAVGLAWLLEMLLARVWGVNALTAAINQKPLASIPYITISTEIQAVEAWRKRAIYLAMVAGVLVLAAIHAWVMPLQNALVYFFSHLD